MSGRLAQSVSFLLAAAAIDNISAANDVFLQLEETAVNASAADRPGSVLRVLEGNVPVGTPFYLRSVADGQQWLLRGSITKQEDGRFQVDYALAATELGEDPAPRRELRGRSTVFFRETSSLSRNVTKAATTYTLALHPFNPLLGFRDSTSGFSIRLLDEAGKPVSGADAILWGSIGDEEWEPIVGPGTSDGEGIVRFSEGRESLPEFTFIAEHEGRSLVGVAHLNRNTVSDINAADPQSLTMRRTFKRRECHGDGGKVD